jgi:hypothetical protein
MAPKRTGPPVNLEILMDLPPTPYDENVLLPNPCVVFRKPSLSRSDLLSLIEMGVLPQKIEFLKKLAGVRCPY